MSRMGKTTIGLIWAVAFVLSPAPETQAGKMEKVETIDLVKADEIQHASAVSEAIDRMSDSVMDCIETKKLSPDECTCLHTKELDKVKTAYQNALKRYPHWKDRVVFYKRENDPMSYNISFGGLRRQLEVECKK